ncbi:hypothetical protein TrLO_g5457 [Triparma laevis f. longispina]|uniref:SET domain-containing protein n=1 Tax=Triparma laevis f. longispina TaxID=1714387 RepID=A0A9W6Z6S8_9STRA|nr:hypothetical protein TrLO_g5457 [Triparma laevis f. longispina]
MPTTFPFTTLLDHPTKNRCAVAPRDLQPGSIVSLTSPFVSSLHRSQKSRRCSRCFLPFTSPTSKRLKCTGCPPNGSTYYCSRTCQISDFITHRYECKKRGTKSLQAAVNTFVLTHGEDGTNFPLDDYWLLRKTYYMAVFQVKSDAGNMKGLVPDLPTKLSKLSEHHIPSDVVLAESVTQSVIALEKGKVEEEDVSNLQKFFVNLLAKFRANNFGILSDLQNVIGGGVYETGAILNHSCSPNCVLVYERLEEGEEMLQKIVVIEEVKEGEELFHSYVELCQPTSERREHLNESYGFMCNCERCISEGTDNLDSKYSEILKSEYPNVKSIIEDSLASAEELMYSEDESGGTERKEYELILKALILQREYLGELHLSRYKSEALALSHSMLLASVPDAIEHCENVCEFLTRCLPQFHPLLVLQRMTLGELVQEGTKRDEEAVEIFKDVLPKLRLLYGEEHEYVGRVEDNLKFLQQT